MLGLLVSTALSLVGAQAAQPPPGPQSTVPIATTIIRGNRQGLPELRGAKRPCTKRVGESKTSLTKARDGQMAVSFEWDPPWFGAVYDHDRDGRIDHLVYPIGILPLASEDPSGEPDFGFGFWQALDTDRDGMADTIVTPAAPKSHQGGFGGWAMVTGTAATGGPVCTMIDATGKVVGPCTRTKKGWEGATSTAEFHPLEADDISKLWSEMVEAASACRLTAADLPP